MRELTGVRRSDRSLATDIGSVFTLFDTIPQAIVMLDPESDRILEANMPACMLLGYEKHELQRARISTVHPDEMSALERFIAGVLDSGFGEARGLRCRTKQGGYIASTVTAARLSDAHAHVLALISTGGPMPHTERTIAGGLIDATIAFTRRLADEHARLPAGYRGAVARTSLSVRPPALEIVGHGRAIVAVRSAARKVGRTEATVLITGESGSGKDLIAREIHRSSGRSDGPFVKVNCASIPRDLFESEFFGHVRGAFTGATSERPGRFQQAHRGTLFLDEIGELPLACQAKLLTVLQDGTYDRVGESVSRAADVRVIAATNRDLAFEVGQGRFRQDMFYRLNVFAIEMPPLRNRREDIPELVEHLVRRTCERYQLPVPVIGKPVLELLSRFDWPGNVREMENALLRALIESQGAPELTPAAFDLGSARSNGGACTSNATPDILDEAMRRTRDVANTVQALQRAGGKIAGPGGAAELLGIKPTTLRSRLKALGIRLQRESDLTDVAHSFGAGVVR